jgi:hypothetical protein
MLKYVKREVLIRVLNVIFSLAAKESIAVYVSLRVWVYGGKYLGAENMDTHNDSHFPSRSPGCGPR